MTAAQDQVFVAGGYKGILLSISQRLTRGVHYNIHRRNTTMELLVTITTSFCFWEETSMMVVMKWKNMILRKTSGVCVATRCQRNCRFIMQWCGISRRVIKLPKLVYNLQTCDSDLRQFIMRLILLIFLLKTVQRI